MDRSFQRVGALFLLAASSAVLASACADNESSFFIQGCLVEPVDSCTVTASPSSAARGGGTLDASFGFGYSCPLLIGNQLVPRGDATKLRTETSRIEVYEADVEVFDDAGNSLIAYTVPTNGFADPGSTTQPGYGVAHVLLVDSQTAQANANKNLISSVRLRGRTLGGTELESNEWQFPITVCSGCLCNLAPCQMGTSESAGTNCHVGSDDLVDCRLGYASCQ